MHEGEFCFVPVIFSIVLQVLNLCPLFIATEGILKKTNFVVSKPLFLSQFVYIHTSHLARKNNKNNNNKQQSVTIATHHAY